MNNQKGKAQFMLISLISFAVYSFFLMPSAYAATKTVEQLQTYSAVQVAPATPDLSKVALSLAFVIFLLFFLSFLIKRFNLAQRVSGTTGMKIIACMPLSTKERVMLIEVGESAVLLGHMQGQIECLHVFDKVPNIKESQAEQVNFINHLVKAVKTGEK